MITMFNYNQRRSHSVFIMKDKMNLRKNNSSDSFVFFSGRNLEKDATLLAGYIKFLSDFKLSTQIDGNYQHIGATLVDTVLQAGLKYDTVVKPKVLAMQKNIAARTVKGLLSLSNDNNSELKKVISWRDDRKPNLITQLAKFFDSQGVSTEDDLKTWVSSDSNSEQLKTIKGIGSKTIDYLKILVGVQNCAIDRHVFRFIKNAGIKLSAKDYDGQYQEAKDIIEKTAEKLNIDKSILDHSIWEYMSKKT